MAGGFSLRRDNLNDFNKFCNQKILEIETDVLIKKSKNLMRF